MHWINQDGVSRGAQYNLSIWLTWYLSLIGVHQHGLLGDPIEVLT